MSTPFCDTLFRLQGSVEIRAFDPHTAKTSSRYFDHNKTMDGAALAVARLFAGYANHMPTHIYFEFENLSTPEASPTPPAFTKAEGVEYYTGLEFSASKDFLRVPLIAGVPYQNNEGDHVVSFYAVTPGNNAGFWGKPFSEVSNSAVFGGALVAAANPAIPANDIVIARSYPENAKVMKPTGEQISVTWNITVKLPAE